jgi:hypothetical protein
VEVLLRGSDLNAATNALADAGFARRQVDGIEMFFDGPEAKARNAVHIVFAGEKVRPEYRVTAPHVEESEATSSFRVVSLEALVRMSLVAFRTRDRTHLRDLIEVGHIDGDWCRRMPQALATRLRELFDNPDG